MCTCGSLQTRETKSRATFNLHEPNPSPHPTYNVENMYPQLFLTVNIVFGGGGGDCNVALKYGNAFRRSAQIFDNYGFCITVPRYFVQDCSSLIGSSNKTTVIGLRSAWFPSRHETTTLRKRQQQSKEMRFSIRATTGDPNVRQEERVCYT